MKRKSPRTIPDFAHHPRTEQHDSATPAAASDRLAKPHVIPAPRVKPQSTSAKFGRRGQ